MKKNSVWIIAALIAALVVAACGSAPVASAPAPAPAPAPAQEAPPPPPPSRAIPRPSWFNDVTPADVLWGIGFINLDDPTLAMQTATQLAQRDVATQLSVLVQSLLTNYARTAGTQNQSSSLRAIEGITKSVVNTNLSGAVPNARMQTDDGTWWVRVSLRKADALKAINDTVDSEAARYADFKAQEALKMLDTEVSKMQSKPLGITEE